MISSNAIADKREHSTLFWGFIVSFLGSLPPGTTNILMVQLTAARGYEAATWFAAGCMVSEMLCVSLCLLIMERINRAPKLMRALEWVSLMVLIWIIVSSFATLKGVASSQLQSSPGFPFLFGLILMAMNPVQVPFWAGWTTVLMQRGSLKHDWLEKVNYVFGIAVGSLVASMLFVACGQAITHWMAGKERTIQWTFTAIFIVIAMIQLIKILRKRANPAPDR
ncbi:MAG: LysE family transporter [Bacteroidota bacterium]